MLRTLIIGIFISLQLSCASTEDQKRVNLPLLSAAPVGNTFAENSGDYIFAPDDIVEIYVHRQPRYSGRFLVKRSGHIFVPGLGPVYAKNRSVSLLQTAVQVKLRPFVKYPRVTVSPALSNSYKVTFSGNIRKPGVYTFNNKTTLLEGLAKAGGAMGESKKIILIRSDKNGLRKRFTSSLAEITEKETVIDRFVLERGDIVFIN